MEVRTIQGRELKIRWNSPRFHEWLAWCYVPAASMMPNEGVGFEARAETAEAAKAALIAKVEAHLSQQG
jgi:hypothetical protein